MAVGAVVYRQGFTLVELMVSLVLGLIITAAVLQVYLANVKTSAIQQSASDLQYASIFGVQQLESHLRMANLGNPVTEITDTTPAGGIVLTLANLGITDKAQLANVTHTAGEAGFTSLSNVQRINSDQLTIQYTNITGQPMYDCESGKVEDQERVIERYFVRMNSVSSQGLILACDAGRVLEASIGNYGANDVRRFGGNGSEFIAGVDQFKVLLRTQTTNADKQVRYVTSAQYMALADPRPAITAVKIGFILRGNSAGIGSDTQQNFSLFGTTHSLKTNQPKQVRAVYESSTLLRNARVMNFDFNLPTTAGN